MINAKNIPAKLMLAVRESLKKSPRITADTAAIIIKIGFKKIIIEINLRVLQITSKESDNVLGKSESTYLVLVIKKLN